MAIWLVRAGGSGQYEGKFLKDNRVYLTWDNLSINLSEVKNWEELIATLSEIYGTDQRRKIGNWASQIWAFSKKIKLGDWVVLPSKFQPTIHFGEVVGEYDYKSKNESPFNHSIEVKWFALDIPRTAIDQDILYSLGAFLTVCEISRNKAEERLRALHLNHWNKSKVSVSTMIPASDTSALEEIAFRELEDVAYDQIADHIGQKFKGHGMEKLIEHILKAKGYTVYRSPEGNSDKGIDLLAAPEPIGFGSPKICIQVKTTEQQVDRPTLDQLIGAMSNFKAEYGILVSWSGFKTTVYKEVPNHFFKVRLWDYKVVIQELFSVYDKLDEDIKSEIPIKKIWTLSVPDEK